MAEQGPLSGQKLEEKYLLGELLGEGGFGAVYKAQHLHLQRQQAIKVLHEQHLRNSAFRDRFLREAQTVAALDHPYIVHVDDFWAEAKTLRAYLVMPFISGGTLQDILQKQPPFLELKQVVVYLENICKALDYAHQRGVVHLDLKPLNLLVHEDGRLLLSDFGLAHLMKQGVVAGGKSLSFGTPYYMAPEHIRGQPDKRSDLYALGMILYEMLVGSHPFEGAIPEVLIYLQLTETPPPVHTLRSELTTQLSEVLTKSLAKDPEQRYQTGSELLADVEKALVVPPLRKPVEPPMWPPAPQQPYVPQQQAWGQPAELPARRQPVEPAKPVPLQPYVPQPVPQQPTPQPGAWGQPAAGFIGCLRMEEGKEPGRVYEVRKDELSIGRSRESDIYLEDLAVSRLHAKIVSLGSGNYAFKDEGSAQGSKVNGQLVNKYQSRTLQEGDCIQLGQTVLVFFKRQPVEPAKPAAWREQPQQPTWRQLAMQQPQQPQQPVWGQQPAAGLIGCLRMEEGKEPGRVYEVLKNELSIGRSRESDIFLEDLLVSRLHAKIVRLGNGNYALRCEGSAKGSKVNGQLVDKYQSRTLQEGDRIQLGQTVLVFFKR